MKPDPNLVQPNPMVWPVCPDHHTPWVLRRAFTMNGSKWLWMSDCPKKCKATPEIHNADGEVAP